MYIDIHVHNEYKQEDVLLLLNLFPGDTDKCNDKGFYSVGLHPWYVNENSLNYQVGLVRKAASKPNFIAVGEIGLDKKVDTPIEWQIKAFTDQLAIAEELGKPVIIHCVRAYDQLLSFRKKSNRHIPWIIHWFNASKQMADDLIEKNCYLSFGHMLFNENTKAFRVFKELPVDRIFFETDDAGLSITEIYEKGSECLDISLEDLQNQIIKNFRNCFGDIL